MHITIIGTPFSKNKIKEIYTYRIYYNIRYPVQNQHALLCKFHHNYIYYLIFPRKIHVPGFEFYMHSDSKKNYW